MPTAQDLVNYSKGWLNYTTRYGWGCWGQIVSSALLNQKQAQYPSHYGPEKMVKLSELINKAFLIDCIGLIKGCYWGQTPGTGIVYYNNATDVDADTMLARASIKGKMITMPDIPGICVWMPGHIGVYIGGGKVIESTVWGQYDGVIMTNLAGRSWSQWLQCPYIDYTKEVAKVDNTPSAFAVEAVNWAIQNNLLKGNSEGDLMLHSNITREQMMVFLKRYDDKKKAGEL